jgi:two-component system, NarL family, invasion response regulator UvrY
VAVRVLIVDDLPPFREVARAVIDASDGFEAVGEVASGEDAVRAACMLRPDLVLMDVNLPGIDGLEATRRIRSAPSAPVVLLLSTWESDDGVAKRCGAAEYIAKSRFDPDRLAVAWRSALVATSYVPSKKSLAGSWLPDEPRESGTN